jgi:hypothetical protein
MKMKKFVMILCDAEESDADVVLDTFGPFNSWECADAWRQKVKLPEGLKLIVALLNEPKTVLEIEDEGVDCNVNDYCY